MDAKHRQEENPTDMTIFGSSQPKVCRPRRYNLAINVVNLSERQ
jgi:hypothetical protein